MSVPLVGSVTPKACSRRRPARDLRKVATLLGLGAVPQDRPHCVHLGVTGASIAARALDFLQHRGRCGERQTCPAPPYSSGIRTESQPASVSAPTNSLG